MWGITPNFLSAVAKLKIENPADDGTRRNKNPAEWRGENYFHLKRVMANLQHMCLCECDHPLQIKTILLYFNTKQ
ncbi:hypothetical protein A2740_01485 [Candidatus Nomurabacteria bacterium RIFCSPHIGHO2_01_FULL_43_16]|nr:MAG: hypothetical protein A2740_01485 [Candidatus Nomurabacteria bacterium RIFCSPHIGHO2_01_FULL_43_16]OGI97880.1 MAG: hypothetical protein A3A11_00920 [Candidatus Nomurabacteria bacterium RIFCSPLOWO2_01_FULL_43_15]